MVQRFIKNKFIYIFPIVVFVVLSIFWIYIQQFDVESTRDLRQLWGHSYWILALYGGITGVVISRKWGGYKSLLGKTILVLSIGLFFQSFGQVWSSYYVFFYDVESPSYPGIGDVGFFGSTLLYIYAVILLAKLSGAKISLKLKRNMVWVGLIPLIMLMVSYFFFLQGYEFDWSDKIRIFLDFGYPLGDAIYVSIAMLALFLSRNVLGGIMKKPILFLIFALIFQYFSNFVFLYQAIAETWYVGNINDYMYLISYFLMTLALINIGSVFKKIKSS